MHGSNRFGLASLTNLDQLPPTGAVVIAPPLKIVNGSGSPLRVLALVPGLSSGAPMAERSFAKEVQSLRLGEGDGIPR